MEALKQVSLVASPEADACPGCGSLGPEHEHRCLEVGCRGCGGREGGHDDGCPAVWWDTWDVHRDGAPPVDPEEDG